MMYCAACRRLFEGKQCPTCGSRKVAAPKPEDICFLTEADPVWSIMLADVLKQHGIPSLSNSTIGAGMAMRAGSMFERVRLYVRFEHLEKGRDIVNELFDSPKA